MSISKYQVFLKVVSCGTFTKAAEALNFTQSGISHAITSLESELGITLLSRNRGGVVLTADGRAVLPKIEKLCAAHHALMQTVEGLKDMDRPKPSSTTAVWRIFLEVKPTPGLQAAPGVQNRAMTIPMTMENTGPPMTGTSLPSSHEGTAMARHTAMPERYFLMVCILRYHSFLLKAQSFPYYSEWYGFRQVV